MFNGRTLYLEREPVVSDQDFVDVRPTRQDTMLVLSVTLDSAAARRMGEVTGANIGGQMAVVFDSRVVSVPTIAEAVGGRAATMSVPTSSAAEMDRYEAEVRARWR